ncbi:hypothetical protein GLAREA_03992 [Glarea lozoyensis ATCC 20868]|uniref:RNA-binding, RBD n=1 Tax=Glarea lozoyensis (strain ATCC 20868 / MF5171) TaxID=1116229 RepID=S3CZH1_GLAL2|nr:uncharacterized protein GLAREA_03992 [Glarea lozoyensis ATCC 20868]EPE31025.1 hypothetical protein GLAREA_03992 [Glarea lozoyensis ATCC 20868]
MSSLLNIHGAPFRQPHPPPPELNDTNTSGNFMRKKSFSEEVLTPTTDSSTESWSTKATSHGGVTLNGDYKTPSNIVTVKANALSLANLPSGFLIPNHFTHPQVPSAGHAKAVEKQDERDVDRAEPSKVISSSFASDSGVFSGSNTRSHTTATTLGSDDLLSLLNGRAFGADWRTTDFKESPASWLNRSAGEASNRFGLLAVDDQDIHQPQSSPGNIRNDVREPFEHTPSRFPQSQDRQPQPWRSRYLSNAPSNGEDDDSAYEQQKASWDSTSRIPKFDSPALQKDKWRRSSELPKSNMGEFASGNRIPFSGDKPSPWADDNNARKGQNNMSLVREGQSPTSKLKPSTASQKEFYRPCMMANGTRERLAGQRYQGDKNSDYYLSHKDLPDDQNCSLWLSDIPLTMTPSKIFDLIDCGAVWVLDLKNPDRTHSRRAADLCFMTPESAATFYNSVKQGRVLMEGCRFSVIYNKHGVPRRNKQQSRVIFVDGPAEIMTVAYWKEYFEYYNVFFWDRVTARDMDGGRKHMQFRFVRMPAQSQICLQALLRDEKMTMLGVKAGYVPDPCDRRFYHESLDQEVLAYDVKSDNRNQPANGYVDYKELLDIVPER